MTEPVPARKGPYKASVEKGKKYFWCACGRSAKQPFCDGSHAGSGITPVAYEAPENRDAWFCGCKASADKPFCDGTHSKL